MNYVGTKAKTCSDILGQPPQEAIKAYIFLGVHALKPHAPSSRLCAKVTLGYNCALVRPQ